MRLAAHKMYALMTAFDNETVSANLVPELEANRHDIGWVANTAHECFASDGYGPFDIDSIGDPNETWEEFIYAEARRRYANLPCFSKDQIRYPFPSLFTFFSSSYAADDSPETLGVRYSGSQLVEWSSFHATCSVLLYFATAVWRCPHRRSFGVLGRAKTGRRRERNYENTNKGRLTTMHYEQLAI